MRSLSFRVGIFLHSSVPKIRPHFYPIDDDTMDDVRNVSEYKYAVTVNNLVALFNVAGGVTFRSESKLFFLAVSTGTEQQ